MLLVISRIKAIGGMTADSERAFHLMSRIQNKLTNRLYKNQGSRLRVTKHIPKGPTKVNWEKAYNIFENLRMSYNVNMNGKKNFEERKKPLQMDLNDSN